MKQPHQPTGNNNSQKNAAVVLARLRQAFFPLMLVCLAGLFIQEDDETGMYILLVVIVLIVGLVNFFRKFFPSRSHKGKDGHGPKTPGEHGHTEDGK